MIKDILLLVAVAMLGLSYSKVLVTYFKNQNKKSKDLTGFDLAKEITSNYDEINIVESKETYFSAYNGKRKVIRLTPKHYERTDYFSLAITSYLAGYSLCDMNQEQSIKLIKRVTPNLDYLCKSPIIVIIIALFTNNAGDAKIGLFMLILLTIYQYFVHQLHLCNIEALKQQFKKIKVSLKKEIILEISETFASVTQTAFIASLILMLREILIILGM